ncbi:MAG: aldehyde ferredoxin oxidoreductase C-terminal domain-containing protein [Chloroflexota bacterium]|nr:aldehyde ferredoxin oxidoreductase C-terminal domain-containing protein [Chloroflexota bacterium]
MTLGGYMGKLLRVDLSRERVSQEELAESILRKYLGGTGLGAWVLHNEVPPNLEWSDPENRLIIASGPVGGTRLEGSGTISVVTKGPLTGGPASSQANGFMGAFMKFAGFDAIVLQGAARRWLYLYLHDGTAELRDAAHLVGKDTWETEEALEKELGKGERQLSVYSIGVAGENLVKFAALVGDRGHVAGHNGTGAVMGSKKLKAVAAARGQRPVPVQDRERASALAKEFFETKVNDPGGGRRHYDWGTSSLYEEVYPAGRLPVKNLTTAFFGPVKEFTGESYRSHWKIKPNSCWACRNHHCHKAQLTEGPYAGFAGEEPEYEIMAAFGSLIGQTDPGAAFVLANECDRLGLEGCEAGWIVSMLMECFERGFLTGKDTDGLEMTWGNVEAVRAMLRRIAHRQGFGAVLADGVKRACERLGGVALDCGIYVQNGNCPRTYDLRAGQWSALFDDVTASTGVKEADQSHQEELGIKQRDPFSPVEIPAIMVKVKAKGFFRDSLVVCGQANAGYMREYIPFLNAVTGWDFTAEEALEVGMRIAHLTKAYAVRAGVTPEKEMLSPRLGAAPRDGPAQGKSILPVWDQMLANYYHFMGWDRRTGYPLPETLRKAGLAELIPTLWG